MLGMENGNYVGKLPSTTASTFESKKWMRSSTFSTNPAHFLPPQTLHKHNGQAINDLIVEVSLKSIKNSWFGREFCPLLTIFK
jgi:hypothetical protein